MLGVDLAKPAVLRRFAEYLNVSRLKGICAVQEDLVAASAPRGRLISGLTFMLTGQQCGAVILTRTNLGMDPGSGAPGWMGVQLPPLLKVVICDIDVGEDRPSRSSSSAPTDHHAGAEVSGTRME